jgi:UDP-N-acetylmuramoylalanine--D-glutamate ligase
VITSSLWRGKRYAVLGLARSGAATVHALLASGAEVVAWDSDEAAREAVLLRKQEPSGHELQPPSSGLLPSQEHITLADPLNLDLTGFAAVVVSPGVPLNRHPIAGHAARYGVPVIGDIELFAQARTELPPHQVVGITGTNGKSTTTALIHHILQTAGVPTTMGGNIGLPILGQEPLPAGGVYVLELSSYQIDLTFTLDCDVAVLLNITPDHLDRYDGFEAYRYAKLRLFAMQSSTSKAINLLVEPEPSAVSRQKMAAHQKTWPALQGPHNAANAIAATAACSALGIDGDAVRSGLSSYPGLPHRMERIRELNGVVFVNDSKATNADSAAPALAAYPAIRWILGGQAKTAELDACVPHFSHVRSAYTIGEAGGMFADLLRPHMAVEESGTLAVAVARAARDAVAGETVLLSPACASFDQFRNFEDRGDAFRQLVEAL